MVSNQTSAVSFLSVLCYVRLPGVKASHLRSLAYQGLYIGQLAEAGMFYVLVI